MQETWVQSLGQEDILEKEMATQPNILTWTEKLGQRSLAGYSPWGRKSVRHNLATKQQQSFAARRAAPVHFGVLNSPGLCPPDAHSSLLPAVMTTQDVSRHCQISIPKRAELLQLRTTGLGEPLVSWFSL